MSEYQPMNGEDMSEPQAKLKGWERVVYNSIFHFMLLLSLCAVIGIGLPILWGIIWKPEFSRETEADLRYKCAIGNVSHKTCLTYKPVCIWDNMTSPDMIQCYYAQENEDDFNENKYGILPRYGVNKSIHFDDNPKEPVRKYILEMLNPPPFISSNNTDIHRGPIMKKRLEMIICHYSEKHLSVRIIPEGDSPNLWSKYLEFDYPSDDKCSADNAKKSLSKVSVLVEKGNNAMDENIFQMKITRKSTGKTLFDMGLHTPFIYADGYMEITTMLINDFVWGLGESYSEQFRHNFSQPKTWTLFSQYDDKELNNKSTSMWGSHPFYLGVDNPSTGDSYGVLLVNTHPIQVAINARPSLSYKTYGGHLEFHFFLGPKPSDVIKQLQELIKLPAMPPYWALGFHACSATCSMLNPTLSQSLIRSSIPVESDCETSLKLFAPSKNKLRNKDFSPIKDSKYLSVQIPQRFFDYQNANWNDKFLKSYITDSSYVGSVPRCNAQNVLENSRVYYPDLFNPNIESLYENSDEIEWFADGYILDWNTPLNSRNLNGSTTCPELVSRYDWNAQIFANLTRQTLCLDSTLSNNEFSRKFKETNPLISDYFALHNLYGRQHTKIIHELKFKQSKRKRPFILSLSTFLGSGHWGGHIGTHINSTWGDMRMTLKQILDFSLFGIPMAAFPVGGHRGTRPSDELLRRWYQLASTQPIMIAHSDYATDSRIIVSGSVHESLRAAVQTRYRLLPYLYTQFWKASTQGELVTKPLFFEFSEDIKTYAIQNQYMLGPSLMVCPALDESETTINAYFPKGQRWYEFFSGHLNSKTNGRFREISAVDQNAPLFLRGGHSIVTHSKMTDLTSIKKIRELSTFQVIAALDKRQSTGDFYLDDGVTANGPYLMTTFEFHYNNISINIVDNGKFCEFISKQPISTTISSIKIFGIIDKPYHNFTDKAVADLYKDKLPQKRISDVTYQNNFGVLTIGVDLNLCKASNYFISWTYPSWQKDTLNEIQ